MLFPALSAGHEFQVCWYGRKLMDVAQAIRLSGCRLHRVFASSSRALRAVIYLSPRGPLRQAFLLGIPIHSIDPRNVL